MNKIKQIWSNKWVKFGTVSVIYLLVFVVWTGNLWLLIGLPLLVAGLLVLVFRYNRKGGKRS